MSILKFIGSNRRTLYGVIRYVKRDGNALVYGFGVNPDYAVEEMRLVKEVFNQTEGREYKHFIFSFDSNINLSNEVIFEIGYRIGLYYAGEYQILMAVHFDTANTHVHYVVNSVNMQTRRKFNQSGEDLANYKVYVNEILKDYNLSPVYIYTGKEVAIDFENDILLV